jgi:hypothetical protein
MIFAAKKKEKPLQVGFKIEFMHRLIVRRTEVRNDLCGKEKGEARGNRYAEKRQDEPLAQFLDMLTEGHGV